MLGLVTLDTLELPHPCPPSDTTAHRIVAAIGLRGTMCRAIAQPSPMFRVVATIAIHACQGQRVRPPSQAYDFHAGTDRSELRPSSTIRFPSYTSRRPMADGGPYVLAKIGRSLTRPDACRLNPDIVGVPPRRVRPPHSAIATHFRCWASSSSTSAITRRRIASSAPLRSSLGPGTSSHF